MRSCGVTPRERGATSLLVRAARARSRRAATELRMQRAGCDVLRDSGCCQQHPVACQKAVDAVSHAAAQTPRGAMATARACTAALMQQIELAPKRNAHQCTGPRDCERQYSLELINCSAAVENGASLNALHEMLLPEGSTTSPHERARRACNQTARGTLASGGWCLTYPPTRRWRTCAGRTETACFMNASAATPSGLSRTYWLPDHHYTPDQRLARLLTDLLRPSDESGASKGQQLTQRQIHYSLADYSLADFGAGVGQFCSELQSKDGSQLCASYDGAGNVEEITQGYVRWFDLTTPLALPRADWVVSLEVGEHVPNQFEPMLIRNLHATNCRGIVLSWGRYTPGARGHGDANYHSRQYLIELLAQLGYRHLVDLAPSYLRLPLRPRHFWFDNNLIGAFERITPLTGAGCTSASIW